MQLTLSANKLISSDDEILMFKNLCASYLDKLSSIYTHTFTNIHKILYKTMI